MDAAHDSSSAFQTLCDGYLYRRLECRRDFLFAAAGDRRSIAFRALGAGIAD
jgi:hypothetical protein